MGEFLLYLLACCGEVPLACIVPFLFLGCLFHTLQALVLVLVYNYVFLLKHRGPSKTILRARWSSCINIGMFLYCILQRIACQTPREKRNHATQKKVMQKQLQWNNTQINGKS